MAKYEEHAFIRIGKDIKADNIPSVVLMCGDEEFLVDFYANFLSKKYVNEASKALDLTIIDRNQVTVNKVIENFETMPMFSERKVVYLPRFLDEKGRLPKPFADGSESIDDLAKYIKETYKEDGDGKNNRLLLITIPSQTEGSGSSSSNGGKDITKSPIYKAVDKSGRYVFDSLDRGQIRGFIEKRFNNVGKAYNRRIVELIVENSGYGKKNVDYSLFQMENDLKKIIAHSGSNREITDEDVRSVIAISPEHNVFDMIDAIGKNNKEEAFSMLHNMLESGGNVFQLLSLITSQLELMLTTCEMRDQGMSLATIQSTLKKSDKIHEFRTKKAFEMAKKFSKKDLKSILIAAYEIEPNIKTGLMDERLALEFFISCI